MTNYQKKWKERSVTWSTPTITNLSVIITSTQKGIESPVNSSTMSGTHYTITRRVITLAKTLSSPQQNSKSINY
jgi:hypothetical protein